MLFDKMAYSQVAASCILFDEFRTKNNTQAWQFDIISPRF